MITLTRRYPLPAAHVLCHPALSPEENERIYGKCANPAGHGHDYGIEISVTGRVDPVTGRIFDPDALDAIVRDRVLSRFAYRRLNDDPAFQERVPTAENIAVVIHDELAGPLEAHAGVRLVGVRVRETRRNFFDYGDPS
ncbi:MAG: 6-carboxytetrahydropterin synthase [Myxococcales bacterium]|nr:6-carboxytetrahydropterin synthase [Myxococcales bacterium]